MKKIKAVIYGEPGVGKSVFASQAPKPFFICTDGNYEWLEDWGAKEEDHLQVFSWAQAKEAFTRDFSKYETIVVDLTEDLFKWCEFEWCQKNNVVHVADLGYGKGYDITRNEFFIEISKLLGLDKNIILIMHGLSIVLKDRRGVEYTKYVPSSRLPDKVIDMIEGRVRYFIRAFAKTEEDADGNLVTKRYLSLSPDGTTEFGITRGLTGDVPRYIPLDWNTFYALVMKSTNTPTTKKVVEEIEVPAPTKSKKAATKTAADANITENENNKSLADAVPEPILEEPVLDLPAEKPVIKPTEPVVEPTPAPTSTVSNDDRIAAIKAKLAALKANKQ